MVHTIGTNKAILSVYHIFIIRTIFHIYGSVNWINIAIAIYPVVLMNYIVGRQITANKRPTKRCYISHIGKN